LTLGLGHRAAAAQYAAVLFGGDYPGPPSFDDHLSLSRAALANNLRTWPNWTGPGATIMELPGNTTGPQFLDAITPFTAGGATPLQRGDVFILFYFGHGGFYSTDGQGNRASERPPAYNVWEEGLSFPGGSVVSDNMLTEEFKLFNPGVNKVFINISCFSGGFWNGNNPGGIGDLEQVPDTLLMASSIEPLCTLTGGLPPRTFEPVYLHNLIANLARNGRPTMTFAQWHYQSWVPGTVTGFRFDDPSDPASYAIQLTVDQEEALTTDDPTESDDAAMGPQPILSISYDTTNQTATISWPFEFVGSTLQSINNLDSTNWVTVSGSTNTNSVTVPVNGVAQFFRLSLASLLVADLQMTMVASTNSVVVGTPFTYTMTISNGGTLAATNVILVDVLPENLTFVDAASTLGAVTNNANALDFSLALLEPGQTVTVHLTVLPTTTGTVTNSAETVSDTIEINWTNNHATVITTVTGVQTNYTLNIQSDTNGTVDPSGTMTVPAGQRQFFAAFPTNAGYWVGSWFVDGVLAQNGSGSFMLTNIQTNHTIQVTFVPAQYIIEVFQNSNGLVTPAGAAGIVFVPQGSNVSFNAFPNSNYYIASWLLDSNVVQSGGSSFTISSAQTNHNLQVIFNPGAPPNTIRINRSSGPNGTVSPDGAQLVPPGTNQTFMATPNNGFTVAFWYLNGVVVQTNGLSLTLTNIQTDDSVFVTFQSLETNEPPSTNSIFGADPPSQSTSIQGSESGVSISLTEGNLIETYQGMTVRSAFGSTMDFSLTYNSYNADGSRAQLDAGLGYGWTHSFNVFLFSQSNNMFRFDGKGRVTEYTPQPDGKTFLSAPGYFETVVSNASGQFTLTDQYQTVSTFAQIPGTPFSAGNAVYRLVQMVDRNQNTITLSYTGGLLMSIIDTYGRVIALAYNGSGHLASIIDPLNRTTTLQYNGAGNQLTTIIDPLSYSVNYTYNPLNQLSQKVDKDARLYNFTYQDGNPVAISDANAQNLFSLANGANWATDTTELSNNQVRVYYPSTTTKTDGLGNTWTFSDDTNGFVTVAIAPDGATSTYDYDPATLMVSSSTDANNHTTSYLYDLMGNCIVCTDALGYSTTYTYDPTFSQITSLTDANQNTTTYQLDANGNRITEIDPLGRTNSYTYDSHGNTHSMTDKLGRTTTLGYDDFGNQNQVTDALGNVSTSVYDEEGNRTDATDQLGRTTGYGYDFLDRLITKTDALNGLTATEYDPEGRSSSVTDPNDDTTSYMYDLRGRRILTTDALGDDTTDGYDLNDNRIASTNQLGQITTYAYDLQNRVIATTNALGGVSTSTYDPVGNLTAATDQNGNTTTYTYDAVNRQVGVTNALGGISSTVYDPVGNVLSRTDANGHTTSYTYDALNRQVAMANPVGGVTTTIYDAVNNQLAVTDPVGNTTTYGYDALNRQLANTNAAGDITTYYYDAVGNATNQIDPNLNRTTNVYDALNRRTSVRDSSGHDLVNGYDPDSNLISITDGDGHTTSYDFDALNRRVQEVDPMGRPTTYAYDAVGNQTNTIDPLGRVTSYTYDALNRRIQETDPLARTTSYSYDPAGNEISVTDPDANTTTYAYDAINRRVTETYPDLPPKSITYAYDAVGNVTNQTDQDGRVTTHSYDALDRETSEHFSGDNDSFAYDASGRITNATRNGWVVTYSYDGADRLTNTTQNGMVISYTYNIPGRTRTIKYPSGRTITQTLDGRDRLLTVQDGAPIATYAYDDADRVTSRIYSNGVVAFYSYDSDDRVISLQHMLGTLIAGFNYAYDNDGNKLYEEKLDDSTNSQAYGYDSLNRLTSFGVGTLTDGVIPAPTLQKTWTLDLNGNWLSVMSNSETEVRAYSTDDELISINGSPLSYDGNGNLTQDATYSYSYDENNRLTNVTSLSGANVVAQYFYDALGRRVMKITNPNPPAAPSTNVYYYDGDRLIEERDGSGNVTATYTYGNYIDEVLTMDRGGQTYYYHQNALWSPLALTDTNGNPVERYTYDVYGQVSVLDGSYNPLSLNSWGTAHSAVGNPWLFTGRQLDEETGIYYYRTRNYDFLKGRFLQRDSLGQGTKMNLYAYANSTPAVLVEAFGDEDNSHQHQKPAEKAPADAKSPPVLTDEEIAKAIADLAAEIPNLVDADGEPTDNGEALRQLQAYLKLRKANSKCILDYLKKTVKEPEKVDDKKIERLLNDLDDNKFAVRAKAKDELEKMGVPALRRLKEAQENPKSSVEVKRSTGLIIAAIITQDAPAFRVSSAIVDILCNQITYKSKEEVQIAKEVLERIRKRYDYSKNIVEELDNKLKELNKLASNLK
jgi:RHS repeat-associated protein/uncharacterized repeat protein (TIGR01451 family)